MVTTHQRSKQQAHIPTDWHPASRRWKIRQQRRICHRWRHRPQRRQPQDPRIKNTSQPLLRRRSPQHRRHHWRFQLPKRLDHRPPSRHRHCRKL